MKTRFFVCVIAILLVYCPFSVAQTTQEVYQKAKTELSPDMYNVYRISDRIIRANKLDDYPWVIEIPRDNDYEVNAQTEQGNLITIYRGAVSTFGDDMSSLASIIAHEMAHQMDKHLYQQSKQLNLRIEEYQKEMKILNEEIDNYNENAMLNNIFGNNLAKYKKIKQRQKEIEKLIEDIKDESLALSRKNEYQADAEGLKYITTAGFKPEGMIKALTFYERMPQSYQENSNHPDVKNRIWQIQTQLNNINVNELKAQGAKNLKSSKPLSFESKGLYKYDHKNLVRNIMIIHSKNGAKTSDTQFKELFGE